MITDKILNANSLITSGATWQDETLYFNDVSKAITLDRLFSDHPKKTTLDYSFFSTTLQKQVYKGKAYLIGNLDSYISEWTEYSSPTSIILASKNSETNIDDEVLEFLSIQENHFIKLYPVPFNNQLTVQYHLEEASDVFVELYSVNGINRIT